MKLDEASFFFLKAEVIVILLEPDILNLCLLTFTKLTSGSSEYAAIKATEAVHFHVF